MSIWIDITEFLTHPHRTGIQRVTGELCAHWPRLISAVPVKVRSDGRMTPLPVETLTVIAEYFRSPDDATAHALERIRTINEQADRSSEQVAVGEADVLLCPEVFFDAVRISFYCSLPEKILRRCCFIVYDLLPLTHPQYFDAGTPHEIICKYFCLLRTVGHLGFISRATQATFYNRFVRATELKGRVVRLGSDGLGSRPKPTTDVKPAPPVFAMVGTIEPRKNHLLVLEAFERLVKEYPQASLVFLGRLGWLTAGNRVKLEDCERQYRQFKWIRGADDRTIRDTVLRARATIFISAVEGFGLPPVESLWLGTPVIASPGLPSLEEIGAAGVHYVEALDPEPVSRAMARLLDDAYWQTKHREAASLDLPDWKRFGADVATWVDEVQHTQATHL